MGDLEFFVGKKDYNSFSYAEIFQIIINRCFLEGFAVPSFLILTINYFRWELFKSQSIIKGC